MRKRHWLACLLSTWLSIVGGQAMAQPPPISPNDVGNPDRTGMLPPPYAANYGSYPQQSYGGMPGGYPPGANAWPNVSPFDGPRVDQTSNQNGLWFNRQITGNRKFFFTAEGLIGHTGHPNSYIGARGVNVFTLSPGSAPLPDNNQQFQETAAGTSTFNTPDRETIAGAGGGGGNATGDFPIFTPQTTARLTDPMNAAGFRGTWGWWNADQSGFQASGFYLSPATSTVFIGDPRGFDQNLYTNANNILGTDLLTHLHAIAGIPLQGADTDHNGLPGVVQPFDIYYRMQYESQVGGFNGDWYASPIFERPAFTIRPMYGARYLRVRENFTFDGADSGLGYTIGIPSANGGGGGGGAATTGFLSPVALEPLVSLSVMQSLLSSAVTSELAGPEAGLRFDVGGDRLKIWTQSKFGLLVNYSSRNLSGFNIGDAYYPKTTATTNADALVMPRGTGANTRFAHQDANTALSPMFEQSIFGKANLFKFVPVLNKSKILSGAEFQAGFTVIVVGNMYRPSNTVNWLAYPQSPQLNDYRSTYITSNYSMGVQWEY